MSTRMAPQRGLSFEYFMWVFTRLSGLGLILVAFSSMAMAFTMGARYHLDMTTLFRWMFFPNSFHVVNSNIPDVTVGWISAFWDIMQKLVVFMGLTHGINGLRSVLEDYLGPSIRRLLLRGALFLLWMLMLFVAWGVIEASA